MNATTLLDRFVDTFHSLDQLNVFRDIAHDGDIEAVLVEPWDASGSAEWRPRRIEAPSTSIDELYRTVAGPLPPMYEELVRLYRWETVDLGTFSLIANLPPIPTTLSQAIARDPVLFRVLSAGGFVQFGRGPDMDYDPVCFDLGSRDADGDCRIVKFDHEHILIQEKLTIVQEIAPSFRRLVEDTIERAAGRP
jgi:hypothetical protein